MQIDILKEIPRGKSELSDLKLTPGSCIMLDLQQNTSRYGLNRTSHFPYFLQVTDAYTRFTVLLGLSEISSAAVFECLLHYSVWFKPNPNFELGEVEKVHADAGSAFKSAEFTSDCEQHGIKITFAAPQHQEMNGICERSWQSIRNIAFAFLVHARVGYEYLTFALEHAWKVHACLPIKNVSLNGTPISPYELFFNKKPRIHRFRVLFCPCVVNVDQRTDLALGTQLNRQNSSERGIRGIHVGLPQIQQAG